VLDFTSILRLIEDDFGLPALNQRDASARSISSSLNFGQRPLGPRVLKDRSCPKGSTNIRITLRGTFIKLLSPKYGKELLLRLDANNVATLLLGPSTGYSMKGGPVTLNDFRVGDHVFAKVRPDPQRALVYGAGTLVDYDLTPINGLVGQITNVSQDAGEVDVRVGSHTLVVNVGKDTIIRAENGKRGTIADLDTGVGVSIYGVLNSRLDEVTTAYELRIVTLGHGKGKPKP
jgi:hypothetical protein